VNSEPFEVEYWICGCRDFQLATVAAAGVDLPDVQRPAEPSLDALLEHRGRLGQGGAGLSLNLSEEPTSVRAVHVECATLGELLARVGRYFELPGWRDRAFRAGLDALPALDAETIRQRQHFAVGSGPIRPQRSSRTDLDTLRASGASLELDDRKTEGVS
jgi:hypothetical protein